MNRDSKRLQLTCLGTGDAFASGGRLNSCFHLQFADQKILLDCGSSALVGLRRCELSPTEISMIAISHLHGDHFAGIPYLLLEAKYVSQRQQPLTLIGPAGLQEQVESLLNSLYPGVLEDGFDFAINYQHWVAEQALRHGHFTLIPWPVCHGRSAQVFALRVEVGSTVLSYTGDSQWCDNLIPLAQGSDLLISECVTYDQPLAGHLDYQTLLARREQLNCRRLALTHVGPEILARRDSLLFEVLNDGQKLLL